MSTATAPRPPALRRAVLGAAAVVALAAGAVGVTSWQGRHEVTAPPAAPVASAACTDALTKAERMMDLERQALVYAQESMAAVARFDAAGIEAQTAQIHALEPAIDQGVTDYQSAAAQCRG